MSTLIDPIFSVYHLTDRQQDDAIVLKNRRSMSIISCEIENVVLKQDVGGRIFASFQRFSKFLPQMSRYKRMARTTEHIYVFGIPDITPPPIENITFVPIPQGSQLAKEWFILLHSPEFYTVLMAEEVTDIDDPDETRAFDGVWNFNLQMVQFIDEWLTSIVVVHDSPAIESNR